MPKPQPPETTSHTLYLPNELDRKIKSLTKYGTADNFIIQCIEEGIVPHWNDWITQEYAKVTGGAKGEGRQRSIRRSSPADAEQATPEKRENKGSEKGKKT